MQKLGEYLYVALHRKGYAFPGEKKIAVTLTSQHPQVNQNEVCAEYYGQKINKALLVMAIASGFAALSVLVSHTLNHAGEVSQLTRGDFGDGGYEADLICDTMYGSESFHIEILEREYGEEEVNQIYKDFSENLPSLIAGENETLEHVTSPLVLDKQYDGYPFEVEWEDTADLSVRESTTIVLKAKATYRQWEWNLLVPVTVYPTEVSESKEFRNGLEAYLQQLEKESREKEHIILPSKWEGVELNWRVVTESKAGLLFLGGLVTAVAVFFAEDRELLAGTYRRKAILRRDYPTIVHKLALYLGAGMSMRGAFRKVESECRAGPTKQELSYLCRELDMGVTECTAYEHLGQRSGISEYIRLSNLLGQNLRKGNGALLQGLREEAMASFRLRLQQGRKLGEEASTKLLLPMVLLLAVVMIIVLVPAFQTMNLG